MKQLLTDAGQTFTSEVTTQTNIETFKMRVSE